MNPHPELRLVASAAFAPYAGPLAAANRGFHDIYNRLVVDTIDAIGDSIPVLVMIGDDLSLLANNETRTERVIPELYHQLKAIGHTAFGVQLWLMGSEEKPLGEAELLEFHEKQLEIAATRTALALLPDAERATPAELLHKTHEIVAEVLRDRKVDPTHAATFARQIEPLVMKMAAAAVRLELDALHRVVTAWRGGLGEAKWQSTYVVLGDYHQPRYRNAARQYFDRVLREQEGIGAEFENRIVYAEGILDLGGAVDLLARHLIDQHASQLIFGDKSRLQKDLLADAAGVYLEELLG
ncbi:hypothetical protein [Aeoliella sp. SH292]|uniref:hypothetical protein n=1 Tax=Aeoliella sp. SH292 TaxID=3454464 RepID=UPI003F9C57E6